MHRRTLGTILLSLVLLLAPIGTAWCDVLGVAPGSPNTTYNNLTGTAYNPATGLLSVSATPLTFQLVPGGSFVRVSAPSSLAISLQLDSSGRLVGGVAGHDLVLTGSVAGYSGVLLTGEIVEYGISNYSTPIDFIDFRFKVTGGAMAALFAGQDLGVTQSIENSSFTGSFSVSFGGSAKGNLGPIPPKPVCAGAIGDFVWNDANRDGIQDAGEAGIDNVTLSLKNGAGALVASTVSGPNGAYLFSGLCAGSYTVQLDTATLPTGFVPSAVLQGGDSTRDSNPNAATIVLSSGTSTDRTVDFGYNSPCSGSLGDLVWHDTNRNGIQDPGEPGLNGVTVNLRHPVTNALISATTSNGSGNYQFSGLCAGNYRVEVLAPAGFVPSAALLGANPALDSNPSPFEVTLSSDYSSDQSIDFGFNTPCTGNLGDLVWNDLNRDGIQNPGEPGIDGVRVILKDGYSHQIATAMSAAGGFYQFGGLCADSYRVEIDPATLPSGMVASPSNSGTDRAADSNGSPAAAVLTTDASSNPSIDFGFNTPCSGSIGDTVWMDSNRDGIQNDGNSGMNGIPIALKDAANTTIATTTTGLGPLGQAGFYSFQGLCAGYYAVELATPAGLQPSAAHQGSDSSLDSNISPAQAYLPGDDSVDPTIDFGFNAPCSGSIGNLVWDDSDRNGVQDPNESGLDGVSVNLRNQANVLLASTTTAAGGLYQFTGLCAGSYQVEVIPPAGRNASPALAGADRGADSNPNPSAVVLPADASSDQSVDFGFHTPCSGSTGDLVWHDSNRDGIQNGSESGIGGAAVVLKNALGAVIASTNTSAAGSYLFGGLCRGSYSVEVATPGGFVASPALAGSDRSLDSNPVPAQVTLAGDASSDLSVDFAFNTPCAGSIGDFVWNDFNADGIQDPGEPGISGVAVQLRDDQNTLLRTTATLSDGSYQFIGLCAGNYRVEVLNPAGMFASVSGAGNDPARDSNPNPQSVILLDDTGRNDSIDFGFVRSAPGLSLAASCLDAPAPGQAITVSALLSNTGNETLTGFSCSDSNGAQLSGTPASLAPGASVTLTGSYLPAGSGSADSISCSASGLIDGTPVSASSSSVCGILSNPVLSLSGSCSNAPAPGEPITLTATIGNTGNENLQGISCSDSNGALLSGVPASLSPGQTAVISGSYLPGGNGSSDTLTCSASGAINGKTVSAATSSSCGINTSPGLTLSETCNNAPAPGQSITIAAVLKNSGNETLTGISCSDSRGALLSGVPASLAPGISASLSGSYLPVGSPSSDTISCLASGAISGTPVSASASATCGIDTALCLEIKKQVSTNCTVSGGKDKHCKSDESKDDHCKRGDADRGYCDDKNGTKTNYCHEVTRKQAHCGTTETKTSHCSKTDCDHGYCDRRDLDKDDYCKIPAAPVCVPVWLDADTQDSAAPMNPTSAANSEDGDDLLAKLSSGLFVNDQIPSWLIRLKHAISQEDSDQGEVRDGERDGETSDEAENKCNGAEYYQGHQRQTGLMYRFILENCGSADLTQVTINDPRIAISNFPAGPLSAGSTLTLTSDQIQQLSQAKFTCSASFLNTVSAVGLDASGRSTSASDDAWVLCNTKTCTFTLGYWKNHPGNWPVTSLKLGNLSYSQNQLLQILNTPPADNGLISLAHQLIAAKLNAANGTPVPATVQQALQSADTLTGSQSVPPIGAGTLAPAATSALVQILDSYNSGSLPGGPTHCGDAPPQACTGSIGDLVWNDLNKNGTLNSGEPGISGVKVTLSSGKTSTTDSTGHYLFTGLCQGNYTVKVAAPCNFTSTTASSVSVTLGSNSIANLSADFGFAKPAVSCSGKIGDYVWNDLNKSGVQDSGETGLAGVQLSLSNGASTSSDASGYYQFTGLCAGEYLVSVATPTGYTASSSAQGNNPARDSKGSPAKVTLGSNNSSVQNIDFGFYKTSAPACTGVIGNLVWKDLNKNGIQDCSEKGIAGVVVKLGNGQSAITDAEGHYQFGGLCAGSYSVSVVTPEGYLPSPSLQGTSRAADSNTNPSSVSFTDNRGSELSVDFGFWKLPTPPATQGKGCSVGYWKNHTVNWPAVSHASDDFDAVFGTNAFTPNLTLLQALNGTGGGLANLARQGSAALLNAEDPRISGFPLTAKEVKAAVLNALLSGSYDYLAAKLEGYNNLGCPLN
jgi:hypothetical protein